MLWNTIIDEAQEHQKNEPALKSYFKTVVFDHDNILSSLAAILGSKLSTDSISGPSLNALFLEVFESDPSIKNDIEKDLFFYKRQDPACKYISTPLLFYKGFQGLACYRAANKFWSKNRISVALLIQNRASEIFGVDIHPAAKIKGGIMIDHATGVVIGETACIGQNVSIYQGVTLGGKGNETGKRHPNILEGASIFASSTILGNIEIGENSIIAAGSLVLNDVQENTTVAGIPARKVKYLIKNQSDWDPGDSSL